jgi:hypothetical protein
MFLEFNQSGILFSVSRIFLQGFKGNKNGNLAAPSGYLVVNKNQIWQSRCCQGAGCH